MSMSILVATQALALVLAVGPAEPRYLPTAVEVDVEPLVAQSPAKDREQRRLERLTSERTGAQVRDGVRRTLEQRGVPLGEDDAPASVTVRLEWKVYLDSHYVAHIVARGRDGAGQATTVECRLCDEPKLAETVAGRVLEVLEALEEVEAGGVVEVAGAAAVEPVASEPSPPSSGSSAKLEDVAPRVEALELGPAAWSGLAVLAVGVGVGVGGIIVVTEDPVVRLRDDDRHVQETVSRRPLGAGLVAAGAGALVAGAVLVAVDQTVLRRRRERRSADAALIPSVSPTGAGLSWVCRF